MKEQKLMPFVSIIILNRNGKELLRKALESIRNNTNYKITEL
jgi:glycosyltransferase involved in cell wall biosynthesis